MRALAPFWRYYGGKWRAAPRYPRPAYDLIVEPFAGAAGYACRYPDRDVLLIDADPVICGIWRWLIGATAADVLAVNDVPDGGTTADIDAPPAARDLVGFWSNPGTATPRKRRSAWAALSTRSAANGSWAGWPLARERIAQQVHRIRHWRIQLGSYESAPDVEATWFVDPPYQTAAGRHYRQQVSDYTALGGWCDARSGQVIACDQQGSDWRPWTAEIGIKGRRGRSAEVYWHRNDRQLAMFGGDR